MIPPDWKQFFSRLEEYFHQHAIPSVSLLARQGWNPFQLLIATLLSLRTKDPVTLKQARVLFKEAASPEDLLALSREEIAQLIYPVGFYNQKAGQIHLICRELLHRFDGKVPADRDLLLSLPGVGLKTANLVLGQAFQIPAICVDTHVHRITNRMGWHQTKTADESEASLRRIIPRKFWIQMNEEMVVFGQTCCTPLSPHCSQCTFSDQCEKIGVSKHR